MCANSWSLLNAKENLRRKGKGETRAWGGSPTSGRDVRVTVDWLGSNS